MQRVLLIANTYYQLILAIQMKNTVLKESEVVVLFSDHSVNAEMIVNRLKKVKIFEEIHYIESKKIVYEKKTFAKRIRLILEASFYENTSYSYYLKNIKNLDFQELIFFNWGIDMYCIYSELYRYNKNIKISIMEEGILSYDANITDGVKKPIKLLRHMNGKKHITDVLSSFYCYYPDFYKGNLSTVYVPQVRNDGKTSDIIKEIFGIKKIVELYNYKYIFFTSVYDFDGNPIGEYELVEKVAEMVGIENLLVKCHPRDSRGLYESKGFIVDKNSSIPWEAIQLSMDFSDKVFITATSGSVLAGSFMTQKKVKTFFLYKLCDIEKNPLAKQTVKTIKRLLDSDNLKDKMKNICVPNSIEEILR